MRSIWAGAILSAWSVIPVKLYVSTSREYLPQVHRKDGANPFPRVARSTGRRSPYSDIAKATTAHR